MAGNLLVPVDFSDATEAVVAEAGRIARATGAQIWLIHVAAVESVFVGYEFGLVPDRDSVARQCRRQHRRLQQYQAALREEGLDATAMLVAGNAGAKIVQEADRLDCDLIVLGSHGHGALHHLLTGSVCEEVLKRATRPVVIVPAKPRLAEGRYEAVPDRQPAR